MKIVLRKNIKHPFFFIADTKIHVSFLNPEQVLDDNELTEQNLKDLQEAASKLIIDIVDRKSSPSADKSIGGIPYAYHKLRRAIDTGEIDKEKMRELLEIEKNCSQPRVSIIKELTRCLLA